MSPDDTVCPHWSAGPSSVHNMIHYCAHQMTRSANANWVAANERVQDAFSKLAAEIEVRGLLKQAGYHPDHTLPRK